MNFANAAAPDDDMFGDVRIQVFDGGSGRVDQSVQPISSAFDFFRRSEGRVFASGSAHRPKIVVPMVDCFTRR